MAILPGPIQKWENVLKPWDGCNGRWKLRSILCRKTTRNEGITGRASNIWSGDAQRIDQLPSVYTDLAHAEWYCTSGTTPFFVLYVGKFALGYARDKRGRIENYLDIIDTLPMMRQSTEKAENGITEHQQMVYLNPKKKIVI